MRVSNKTKFSLYILIALTLAFIWGHSMVPADLSKDESSYFMVLINEFLSSAGISISVTDHLVRKTAHFMEYALLGGETAALQICKAKLQNTGRSIFDTVIPKNAKYGVPVFFWIGAPVIDELIQYFVPGRACMLRDVLLDMCGFLTGFLLLRLVFCIIPLKN